MDKANPSAPPHLVSTDDGRGPFERGTTSNIFGANAGATTLVQSNATPVGERSSLSRFQAKLPQYFTRFEDGGAAIIYEKSGLRAEEVALALGEFTGKNPCQLNRNSPGILILGFDQEEALAEFLQTPIIIKGKRLRVERAVYSSGTTIQIRAEMVYEPNRWKIETQLLRIFKDAGDINYISPHYIPGPGRVRTGTVDFILEVPAGKVKDLMLPRVASVSGSNTLFTWPGGGMVCYRCGGDAHVKNQCSQPLTYRICESGVLENPKMVKAFPNIAFRPAVNHS